MKTTLLLFTFCFYFFGFTQSKKEQIDQLNLHADSLQNIIDVKSAAILNFELQINQNQIQIKELQEKYKTLDLQSTNLIAVLNKRVIQLSDSLKSTMYDLSKYSEQRDFSNGLFTEEQIQFMVEYFTNKLKNVESSEVVLSKENDDLLIHIKGEPGYVASYKLAPSFNPKYAGDLDKDGSSEILFQVMRSSGGSYEWVDFYCLKFVPNSSYVLVELGVECPCSYSCGESSYPEILGISSNKLIIKKACYSEDDAQCCPSSEIEATYEFKNNQLFLKR